MFQFSWDLTMDWGIVVRANSKDASEITFLGLSMRRTRLLGKHGLQWLGYNDRDTMTGIQ